MGDRYDRYRRRRAERRRRGSGLDCADCGDCGDCSPFMLSPLLLLLRVLPGAFRADAVDPWVARPGGLLGRVASRMIRSYQLNVSVPRARSVCSMTPTCSRYGLQAVSAHGFVRGCVLVVRRVRRCGTDSPRFDPVPVRPATSQP